MAEEVPGGRVQSKAERRRGRSRPVTRSRSAARNRRTMRLAGWFAQFAVLAVGAIIILAVIRWFADGAVDHVQRLAPPTPATSAGPLRPAFGDGTQVVGDTIQPGVYVSTAVGLGCSWERLSGVGGSIQEVLVSGGSAGQAIVEVRSTDAAFVSRACGPWTGLAEAQTVEGFGDGDWAVHHQVAPGRWAAAGAAGCSWERATGYAHDAGEIVARYSGAGEAFVDIEPNDVRFSTSGCGTWTRAS